MKPTIVRFNGVYRRPSKYNPDKCRLTLFFINKEGVKYTTSINDDDHPESYKTMILGIFKRRYQDASGEKFSEFRGRQFEIEVEKPGDYWNIISIEGTRIH